MQLIHSSSNITVVFPLTFSTFQLQMSLELHKYSFLYQTSLLYYIRRRKLLVFCVFLNTIAFTIFSSVLLFWEAVRWTPPLPSNRFKSWRQQGTFHAPILFKIPLQIPVYCFIQISCGSEKNGEIQSTLSLLHRGKEDRFKNESRS